MESTASDKSRSGAARSARAVTKKQIRYIQSLRRALGVSDEVYAEMKASVGVASTTELDERKFNELLRRLEGDDGDEPVDGSARGSGARRAPSPPRDKAAMISKIEAILAERKLPWSYVDGMARRMFGVERLRFCDPKQTYKVLQALAVYQKRKERSGSRAAGQAGEAQAI